MAKNLMSMYTKWLIFFSRFMKFYPPELFLNVFLRVITTVTNNNVHNTSPRKIPLWIFTSIKHSLPAVSSSFQFSLVFSTNFMTSLDIWFIFRQSVIQLCWTIAFLLSIYSIATCFHLVLLSLMMCWSVYCRSPVSLVHLQHPLCSSGNCARLISEL